MDGGWVVVVASRILVSAQALGHCHNHRGPEKEPELDNTELVSDTLDLRSCECY